MYKDWAALQAAAAPPARVVFCSNCGTIMEEPSYTNTNVQCRMCGTVTPSKVFEELVVRSASAAVVIVDDEAADVGATQKKKVRATAKEKCPSCGNPEMEYFTMQLRSADEGQTVFYECAKCGHTFSTNT